MIGVLAIISIIAGLLVPRVLAVISQSNAEAAAVSVASVRSAALTYFTKYNVFGDTNGGPFVVGTGVATNWAQEVLVPEGLLDSMPRPAVGTALSFQLIPVLSSATAVNGTNAAFDLDGTAYQPNEVSTGATVLVAYFYGVPLDEARSLNQAIDSNRPGLGEDAPGHDLAGRVKYDFAGGAVGTVCIYLAHK